MSRFFRNKYDEFFDFRLADIRDVEAIMKFLGEEWKKDHILSRNRELFLWQHGNSEYGDNETINVYLMTDKSGNIVGLNGFVQYSDKPLLRYVSSCITKVRSDIKIPMSGIELVRRFKEAVPANAYYSSGTSENMLPIGKNVFHYTVGVMQQYYVLNPSLKKFKIAGVTEGDPEPPYEEGRAVFEEADFKTLSGRFDFDVKYFNQAYKSPEFIEKRYFRHPVYRYEAFGVRLREEERYGGVLIGREIRVDDARIFRFVDYLGDIGLLSETGGAVRVFIKDRGYEYADLTAADIPPEIMKRSGFRRLKKDDENIIPMHFEPFEKKNVYVRYQKSNPDITIFKADGDQDRPNFM